MVLENYSLNYYRAVSRFISVLKIGEKSYAKWAPRCIKTRTILIVVLNPFMIMRQSIGAHAAAVWPLHASSCAAFSPKKKDTSNLNRF
jgi:hypothetical protein